MPDNNSSYSNHGGVGDQTLDLLKYGFPESMLKTLVCQKDQSQLALQNAEYVIGGSILSAALICINCESKYQIKDGIVMFLQKTDLDSGALMEIEERDLGARNYDRRLELRRAREIPSTMELVGEVADKKILELGAGTGRFTTEMSNAESIVAVDFSLESLKILGSKIARLGIKNVGLICADVTLFKTLDSYFDIALSTQVLEHIEKHNVKNFTKLIFSSLKPGGYFVCSVYHQDLRRRLRGEPSTGRHSEKIFFHYYTTKEIIDIFSESFIVNSIKFIDIVLPLSVKLGISARLEGKISRIVEKLPFLRHFGHLILFKVVK